MNDFKVGDKVIGNSTPYERRISVTGVFLK